MSYYLLQNDETKGPYTLGQLRAMWNSGAITGKTLHSQEGYSEWLPLSTIIDELEPAPSPPPLPPTPPPQYYRPAPQPKRKGVGILGGCLLVFLGLFVLGAIMSASKDRSPSSSSGSDSSGGRKTTRTMSIEVGWGFDSIRIKNTGSPDLAGRTLTVYINGTPPFAYKADWPAPAVGETVRIPLTEFVNKGSRFNPTTQAVSKAWIGGAGYDYAAYGQ